MTKPITGTAILMLQDEGKLNVADPVAKYIPEFANLKSPSGKAADLTSTQILTHTSGLGEAGGGAAQQAKTLADLVPLWLAAPMQYEPGEQWKYTQSGINAAARIVEIIVATRNQVLNTTSLFAAPIRWQLAFDQFRPFLLDWSPQAASHTMQRRSKMKSTHS